MSRKKIKQSFEITRGHRSLRVSPWTDSKTGTRRWRFSVEKPDGKRQWITRSTKDEASAAAEKWLEESGEGIVLSTLSGPRRRWHEELEREVAVHDQEKVLEFVRSLQKSGEIVACVARFVAFKLTEKGEETPHFRRDRAIVEAMAAHFAGRSVVEILVPDLERWWMERCEGLGWKRKKAIRAALVQFWLWARKQRLTGPEADTVAQCLPQVASEEYERAIIESFETFKLLALSVLPQYRAWLVLGSFEGMRPEEIAASTEKKKGKRGMDIKEIDWRFSTIRLPNCVVKANGPRNVPLHEASRLGLEWAGIREGMTGPVCLKNPSDEGETKRLGELVFPMDWPVENLRGTRAFPNGWPADVLRHTYASYRIGVVQEHGPVAMEMGTSVKMLKTHYDNPRAREEGLAWFAAGEAFFRLLLSPLKTGVDTTEGHSEAPRRLA